MEVPHHPVPRLPVRVPCIPGTPLQRHLNHRECPFSQIAADNDLNIADFHVGDRITHDRFGLGKVVQTQDKGKNSVITVDFGSTGVKRLMLRLAPIEKL